MKCSSPQRSVWSSAVWQLWKEQLYIYKLRWEENVFIWLSKVNWWSLAVAQIKTLSFSPSHYPKQPDGKVIGFETGYKFYPFEFKIWPVTNLTRTLTLKHPCVIYYLAGQMCAFLARSATDGLFLKSYRLQEVKNKTEYWVKSIVLKHFFNI